MLNPHQVLSFESALEQFSIPRCCTTCCFPAWSDRAHFLTHSIINGFIWIDQWSLLFPEQYKTCSGSAETEQGVPECQQWWRLQISQLLPAQASMLPHRFCYSWFVTAGMLHVKPTVRQPINYSGQIQPCVAAGCWNDGRMDGWRRGGRTSGSASRHITTKSSSAASRDIWKWEQYLPQPGAVWMLFI